MFFMVPLKGTSSVVRNSNCQWTISVASQGCGRSKKQPTPADSGVLGDTPAKAIYIYYIIIYIYVYKAILTYMYMSCAIIVYILLLWILLIDLQFCRSSKTSSVAPSFYATMALSFTEKSSMVGCHSPMLTGHEAKTVVSPSSLP